MNIENRLIKFLRDSAGAVGIILILVFVYLWFQYTAQKTVEKEITSVIINTEVTVDVDVARTEYEHAQGLAGRELLGDNEGMLFIFGTESIRSFWMKGMLIPIDIIWIGSNSRIVDISHEVPIPTDEEFLLYTPDTPVRFVLEVPAGFVHKNSIRKGDPVTFAFE